MFIFRCFEQSEQHLEVPSVTLFIYLFIAYYFYIYSAFLVTLFKVGVFIGS